MKLEKKPKTPLHLRLTTKDWVESFKELTRAELGVLYYIRTKDPYGDRSLDVDCSELGKLLGIHRTSVSRALEELKRKGFIDMEIEKARVQQKINNRRLTLLTSQENKSNNEQIEDLEICASAHKLCADAQLCAPMHSSEHLRTSECADAQPCAPTHSNEHPRTRMSPQPLLDNSFSVPQTIQTYINFIQTLSDRERANFLNFCEGKTKNLSQPVNDIEAWLAHTNKAGQNRWEVYYKKFLAQEQAQSQKSTGSANSRMAKKFQQEIEQQRQQAIETLKSKI